MMFEEVDRQHFGCIGINLRLGDDSQLCARGMMCPKCEQRRAGKRAWNLTRRLENDILIAEDAELELQVGVLTLTLPGQEHPIRHASLRKQYDYATQRRSVSGHAGLHSMRGLNKKLLEWGVSGGCHNMEFTWNPKKEWWNLHTHSVIVGYADDLNDAGFPLKQSGLSYRRILGEPWLMDQQQENRSSTELYRLGFGGLYTLDWAKQSEFEQAIRYCSKVAYATKPVKAPKEKRLELKRFFNGNDGATYPRLSRPIGDWGRAFVPTEPV